MYIDKFTDLIFEFHSIYSDNNIILAVFILLLIGSYTDIKYRKIPNILNVIFIILRLGLIPFIGISWVNAGGALMGFLILLVPAMALTLKMGGDIKTTTVVGMYIGVYAMPLFIAFMCLFGLVYAFVYKFILKKPAGLLFPLIPFLLLAHVSLIILNITYLQ